MWLWRAQRFLASILSRPQATSLVAMLLFSIHLTNILFNNLLTSAQSANARSNRVPFFWSPSYEHSAIHTIHTTYNDIFSYCSSP
ncbi:hypothetical protein L208DRAFT_120710 [Tricholoma matsutake]|nr:hypothetical protein L208DRAFT_120710 [Tricholoma matsutake 945]